MITIEEIYSFLLGTTFIENNGNEIYKYRFYDKQKKVSVIINNKDIVSKIGFKVYKAGSKCILKITPKEYEIIKAEYLENGLKQLTLILEGNDVILTEHNYKPIN